MGPYPGRGRDSGSGATVGEEARLVGEIAELQSYLTEPRQASTKDGTRVKGERPAPLVQYMLPLITLTRHSRAIPIYA
jgi:hypothetical protein